MKIKLNSKQLEKIKNEAKKELPITCTCYLVGGAVRNLLLDKRINERDWVIIGLDHQQMQKSKSFKAVGKSFPVFIYKKNGEEYALARTEKKTGQKHGDFTFDTTKSITIEEDLQRRDFTINSMAIKENGELIDPYNGYEDIQNKILKHTSNAFQEDALRLLRGARLLSQLGKFNFRLHHTTIEIMKQISYNKELQALPKERLNQEYFKALNGDNILLFWQTLNLTNADDSIFGYKLNFTNIEFTNWKQSKNLITKAKFTKNLHTDLANHLNCIIDIKYNLNNITNHQNIDLIKDINYHFKIPKIINKITHLTLTKTLKWLGKPQDAEFIYEVAITLKKITQVNLLTPYIIATFPIASKYLKLNYENWQELNKQIIKNFNSVGADKFIKQGIEGKDLGEAIKKEQKIKLNQYIKNYFK